MSKKKVNKNYRHGIRSTGISKHGAMKAPKDLNMRPKAHFVQQVRQDFNLMAADRWAPAIRLMREGGQVVDFESSEPSYKTDHAAAMLALARLVEK
jgi:hypothetical protein